MILGIGTDIIEIKRIAATLERFGDRFKQRVFTEIERKRSEAKYSQAASYAKRFAAKEACSKALGLGMRMGVVWREIGIINLPSGKPTIKLTGKTLTRLETLTPKNFKPQIDISITDEIAFAQAFVVISAWPKDWEQKY